MGTQGPTYSKSRRDKSMTLAAHMSPRNPKQLLKGPVTAGTPRKRSGSVTEGLGRRFRSAGYEFTLPCLSFEILWLRHDRKFAMSFLVNSVNRHQNITKQSVKNR